MKIIKEKKLSEDIANLERVKDKKTIQNVVMADAEQQSKEANKDNKKLIDPMERKKEKPFMGATKQPLPKPIQTPKVNLDESLFEDYEDDVEWAIGIIRKYYYNDLLRFLQSFAYNSPIGIEKSQEVLVEIAEYLWQFMDESLKVNESLNESTASSGAAFDFFHKGDYSQQDIIDAIDKALKEQNLSWEEYIDCEDVTSSYDYMKDFPDESVTSVSFSFNYDNGYDADKLEQSIESSLENIGLTPAYYMEFYSIDESLKESLREDDEDNLYSQIDHIIEMYVSDMSKEDLDRICKEIQQRFIDAYDFIQELRSQSEDDEDFDESLVNEEGNSKWKELSNRQSKQDKKDMEGLWDRVYSELSTGVDTAVEGPHKIKAGRNDRYSRIFIHPEGLGVRVESEDKLDFAKKVADYFGLQFKSYQEPGQSGTLSAVSGVIVIPEDLYDETEEETAERLASK